MKSSRIVIWKFADAPKKLQALCEGSMPPHWITLVPHALMDRDLDIALMHSAGGAAITRRKLPNGDVVYIGASLSASTMDVLPARVRSTPLAGMTSAK